MTIEELKAEWQLSLREARSLSFSYKYMDKLLAVAEAVDKQWENTGAVQELDENIIDALLELIRG